MKDQLTKSFLTIQLPCATLSFCQDEISALRRRLEKSEKDRNELRQTTDSLETKVCVASQSHTHTNTHVHTHMHTYTVDVLCAGNSCDI